MGKLGAMRLLASVLMLMNVGGNAHAQQVGGGMGEPIHIGTFDARGEGRLMRQDLPQKSSAKARHTSDAGTPQAHARTQQGMLPGKHLR